MANRGRKSAYETVIKPRFSEIREWLENGATDRQIAENLGVAMSTFCKYKAEYEEFTEFLKKGRQPLVMKLRGALVKKALGFTYNETKKYKKKDMDGNEYIYIEETTKQSLPDVAALNLCLKNYDPDNWANDPQSLALKREELELKKKIYEDNKW